MQLRTKSYAPFASFAKVNAVGKVVKSKWSYLVVVSPVIVSPVVVSPVIVSPIVHVEVTAYPSVGR